MDYRRVSLCGTSEGDVGFFLDEYLLDTVFRQFSTYGGADYPPSNYQNACLQIGFPQLSLR
jgi:hypothetical protein